MNEVNDTDINLLSGRKESLHKERVASAKAQFLSLIVLIAFGALVVGVFSIRGMMAYRQRTVEAAISDEELALAQLKPVEEKYVLLANKLKLIDDYMNAKGTMLAQADSLFTNLVPNVSVSALDIDVEGGTVGLSAIARDYVAVVTRLDQLEQEAQTRLFSKAALTGLGRSADGSYTTNTEYQLEK